MITHYNIAESELASKAFESEAMYFCYDTGNVYVDSPVEGSRVHMSSDSVILATEASRVAILAPIPNKMYCVLETGCIYIYQSGWNRLGNSQFIVPNLCVSGGSLVVNDARVIASDTAEFIPDLSVTDLATNVAAVCADGKVTITLTSSFDIPGMLKVN